MIATDTVAAPPEVFAPDEQTPSCLRVTPSPTLVLRETQASLTLENGCDVALDLTRVALRLGNQGFTLSAPPARLAAGQRVQLTIADSRGPSASERLEIVLIDAATADGRDDHYAIDVFSALTAE